VRFLCSFPSAVLSEGRDWAHVICHSDVADSPALQVACERYDAQARFMKWDSRFIAKNGSCFAIGGTRDTAVLRAEKRIDAKGKLVMIDEGCRIRSINDHDRRKHAMGIFHSASRPEEVFAFTEAALRDAWVSMLQVHMGLCVLLCGFVHSSSAQIACAFFHSCQRWIRRCKPLPLLRSRHRRMWRCVVSSLRAYGWSSSDVFAGSHQASRCGTRI